MVEYIILIVAAIVAVTLVFFRVNTALCFLALCAGSVLVKFSGDNMGLMASSLTSGMDFASNAAEIILLFLPVVVCAFITRGQFTKALVPLSIVPALCMGLLAAIFINPLLAGGASEVMNNTETWSLVEQYQEFIVGVGIVVSIILISMSTKRPDKKHKKALH